MSTSRIRARSADRRRPRTVALLGVALASTSALLGIGIGTASAATTTTGSSSTHQAAATTATRSVTAHASSSQGILALAAANLGKHACDTNSLGGVGYGSSCTGNGGQPEYWCSDFAIWVWQHAGVTDLSGLTARAATFYSYATSRGILSSTPHVGDVAIFSNARGDTSTINHVAIVSQVNANGTIETLSGDWNGVDGSEAEFSSTSTVVQNAPAYSDAINSYSSVMGMYVVGFVSPPGMSATSAYPLYHSIRNADGTWAGWGEVQGIGAPSFDASDAAISSATDGSAQIVAIGNDGNLYHTIRNTVGTWAGWGEVQGIGAPNFAASDASIAVNSDGSAQIVAIGNDGNLYHTIRNTDGTWAGWGELQGVGAPSFTAKAVSITADSDGSAQIVAIGNDGNLYHTIRNTDGTWAGWGELQGVDGAASFSASDVSISAATDGSAQVVAIGNDGNVYHTIRNTDGTWAGWGELQGVGAPSFSASSVAITVDPDGSSQVVAIGNDGMLYHTIRNTDGTWAGWGEVQGADGAPSFGAATTAITADTDGSTQILATGNR
jgi:hypothetical protein